jgi:hypothetical protein
MKAAFRKATERGFAVAPLDFSHAAVCRLQIKPLKFLLWLKRNNLAPIIHTAALDNSIGALLRFAIRRVQATRSVWFARKSQQLYPAHSKLVRDRLLELA